MTEEMEHNYAIFYEEDDGNLKQLTDFLSLPRIKYTMSYKNYHPDKKGKCILKRLKLEEN